MARSKSVPSYRLHKQSGQAVVTLVNPTGRRKDVLLGRYGTTESRAEYARVIAEWEANSRRLTETPFSGTDLTVNEVLLHFWHHVEQHYRHCDGTATTEVENYRYSLRPVRELYGHTLAGKFGPLALKAVRQKLIDSGLSRNLINQRIGRVKRAFKWAVGEELVPPAVYQGLQTVSGLAKGRSAAKERPPVAPVTAYEAGAVTLASDRAAREAHGEDAAGSLAGLITGDGLSTLADWRAGVAFAEGMVRDREVRGGLFAELATLADDAPFNGTDAVFLLEALTGSLPQARGQDADDGDDVPDDPLVDPTHPQFLAAVGVPVHAHAEPDEWDGWTAGMVRRGAGRMAGSVGWTADALLSRAMADAAAWLGKEKRRLKTLRKGLRAAEKRADEDEAAARRRALVPAEPVVGTVVKYEGHLQRQLTQTLHELERRQALRSDCPPHPPAALDVTVHAAEDGVATLLPLGG